MTQRYRYELINLKNKTPESEALADILLRSMVIGPPRLNIVKIDDSTEDGRQEIKEYIKAGFQVISIRKKDGNILISSTPEGQKAIENYMLDVRINPERRLNETD